MPTTGQTLTRDKADATAEPETGSAATLEQRAPWAHTSLAAMLGLTVGVIAATATATGLLAPLGVTIGAVGAVLSVLGLARASRRGMTGHGAALAGLIASLTAVVVGLLAIQGRLSWLDSDTDQVARLHAWLNSTFPWLRRW
jgi:hypothetical protein